MPYVLVMVEVSLFVGPVLVGDEDSDVNLMKALGAKLVPRTGQLYNQWIVYDAPRNVLNKLDTFGFKVVTSTGVGQSLVWTMHLDDMAHARLLKRLAAEAKAEQC